MQRWVKAENRGRGGARQRPKVRKAPIARVSADAPEQFYRLNCERDKAPEQPAAISESPRPDRLPLPDGKRPCALH